MNFIEMLQEFETAIIDAVVLPLDEPDGEVQARVDAARTALVSMYEAACVGRSVANDL